MINRPIFASSAALVACLAFLSLPADAQQAATPAATILSLGDIETRLTAQGIRIHEVELRDLVAEVEGRDAQGRKVELLIDRRSGEILSQKPDH